MINHYISSPKFPVAGLRSPFSQSDPPQCFSFVEKYEDEVVEEFVKLVQSKSFVEKRKSPLKKALKRLCNDKGGFHCVILISVII